VTSAPCQASGSDDGGARCPVHNSVCHSVSECWENKKLTEQFRKKQQQPRQEGAPSRQREGKQKMDPEEEKNKEMAFQNVKREMKAVYGHSDSDSNDSEHRKALHIMFGGSWVITSQHIIKTLCREVAAATPAPKVSLHHKWMETSISFDASNCPKSMVGARQLPLIISLTISNIKLYHVLIDGGATLNLISLAALKKLQIPMPKLQPSRPFSRVGSVSVMSRGCISLPVTFEMPENFCTESVLFDVTEVNLPFNAILCRPTLYQFMVVTHYR
jgi:hypothetical protein